MEMEFIRKIYQSDQKMEIFIMSIRW